MADGPMDAGEQPRKSLTWADSFRVFQVALDPRKLVVAAAGLLAMSVGWYLISLLFAPAAAPPKPDDSVYSAKEMQKELGDRNPDGKDYTPDEYAEAGRKLYERDLTGHMLWASLAGPGGRLRTLPWFEYRGPNPYVLVSDIAAGTAVDREQVATRFLSGTVPVLVEPLNKLLLPVVKLFDPYPSFWLRLYLLLCLAWSVACWAFFGGVITRIAAVQLTGQDRVTLPEAVKFVIARYSSYVLAPLVPVGLILVIVLCMMLYGFVAMIPVMGDVFLYGLLLPLVLFGGVVIAVLLVGLVSYPLMTATISTEGTDTFDALSRGYNYVFQAPWTYIGHGLLAVLYGSLVTFFVVFAGSLAVYVGKWAVSQAPLSERWERRPDYLFVYAPESFGWKQLLLKGSDAELVENSPAAVAGGEPRYVPLDRAKAERYYTNLAWYEKAGAGMATVWTTLVLLLVIGFSYSYFWSASTLIYLAMRQKVDETEPDEIYLDDDFPEPLPPPATTVASGPAADGFKLPPVEPPTIPPPAPVPPPAAAVSPPTIPPPAPVPPPAAAVSPEVGLPTKADLPPADEADKPAS